ncbi:hypothetical protein T265_05430 [Opisthorchis viverrini]|uniref:Uncharacterized protein n=1 Tax=Opisthorchis viverrini TaxID=6198 RepID=A0A074ZVZ6_OPIVI|nr:hypothetical protein T265_05430 [Opisthorchis viverrini]KER27540.1 hypothetical protein T265_05430 [Opisthorchis viverrini]
MYQIYQAGTAKAKYTPNRITAQRGCPVCIYKANGTNVCGTELELKQNLHQMNQERVSKAPLQRGCDWFFSPPRPATGRGIWERMVRCIRRILRPLLGDQLVTDEVLTSSLTKEEKIINDRPLTML